MIYRTLSKNIIDSLKHFPVVAILGPRQCGKSTLAKHILRHQKNSLYFDLEKPSDLNKLHDPEFLFKVNSGKLICLDEIHRLPQVFTIIRSACDENNRPCQFLILGSASPDLIRQSSESLAGRICYHELTPFKYNELRRVTDLQTYWFRGGFPKSLLEDSDEWSIEWRNNYIMTFLERDIPSFGINISAQTLRRLWHMCAHLHGDVLNSSKIGASLGLNHVTVRKYIDIFVSTYNVRLLPPFEVNLKKRIVKSPKIYIRDAGILHALQNINSFNDLLGHTCYGYSWEGLVLENIISSFPRWDAGFFRTSDGTEIDLILQNGKNRIAIECKASVAPVVTKGFWNSLEMLNPTKSFIASPVEKSYPVSDNVSVAPINEIIDEIGKM